MRKADEYVIDYGCEDACVKVANVKSEKTCSPEKGAGKGCSQEPTRTPACTYLQHRWTSLNRLQSPQAYGLMGQ